MGLRVVVGAREPLAAALKRLRKLLERQRRRKAGFFVRNSELRRTKEHRKWPKARRETELARQEGRR